MKLSHKVAKIAQPLTYKRAWRKVRRKIYPIPLPPLLAKIDQGKLAGLRDKHTRSSQDYVNYLQHYVKYLDVETHLKLNIARVQDLQIHRSPPQDVLDIGCGGGFFLFILKELGHRGLGLDTDEIPLFADLIDLLQVERRIHAVRAFEPMPELARKFDWITAFSTAFHGVEGQSWRWDVAEWEFFLGDLRRFLKPGGRVFFGLNPSYGGDFYTPEMLALFRRTGATIERENILFPPMSS